MGSIYGLIDNEYFAGLAGSKSAFGAPAPFSLGVTFHAGGLHDLSDVEDQELSISMFCEKECSEG